MRFIFLMRLHLPRLPLEVAVHSGIRVSENSLGVAHINQFGFSTRIDRHLLHVSLFVVGHLGRGAEGLLEWLVCFSRGSRRGDALAIVEGHG